MKRVEIEKKHVIKWIVTFVICCGIAFAIANGRGFAWHQAFYLNARYLSDGFFVIGLLTAGMGGLVWISSTGFFDIFGYAFKSLLVLFSSLKHPKDHPTFYNYKTMKAEKHKKPDIFLLIIGLLLIALSVLFLVLYYSLQ